MDAQVDGPSTVALAQTKALVPGYLLTPFGWAAKPLAAIIQSEPSIAKAACSNSIDRVCM